MRLSDKLRGVVRAEIISACPEALLNACAMHGITVSRVSRKDACSFFVEIYERDWGKVQRLAQSVQAESVLLERRGGSMDRRWLLRRAVLICSLLLVGALLLWSGLHIWEIEVYGCEQLTCGQVMRALEDCGVAVGRYWPGFSADAVRSKMLLRLPKLAWMTVNVSGSRALVYVVERVDKPEVYSECDAADIRAARTGILRQLTVFNGHPLVRKGSAVTKGEILVTGSMDSLSHPTRLVRAAACALADTWYEWNAVEPLGRAKTGNDRRIGASLAVRFGKIRVNLISGSRKELDGYDKIVHEYTVGLKGLFVFPVSLLREEYRMGGERAYAPVSAGDRLRETLASQLDGEILQARCTTFLRDGCLYTTLRAHCLENIAQTAELETP